MAWTICRFLIVTSTATSTIALYLESSLRSPYIEVCLRATIVFRFGFWACLGYLRLSAWWLRFQPVFLWGCTPLVFNLSRLSTRQ